MTYWMIIALIVCLAVFVPQIVADREQMNVGADGMDKKKLIESSQMMASELQTSSAQDVDNRFNKRASFMPSRGKKEGLEEFDGINDPQKKASAGFLPMRGRKDDYNQDQSHGWYISPQYDYENSMDDKRAGFMPMRGRKNGPNSEYMAPTDDVYPTELDALKRMSAFMPMRGRKEDNSYYQSLYALPQPYRQSYESIGRPNWMEGEHSISNSGSSGSIGRTGSYNGGPELAKKANAFFGARGKRSVNNVVNGLQSINAYKRVGLLSDDYHNYNDNFFAARG